ncbi:hypothetical protein FACS1894109_02120 [Spirochaetia bacterium]|nr:hypothetical protein FACS1894109_02120 [Spirochaetia bacterium]
MDYEFYFRKSAFEHHLTEADIRHAFETCRYMGLYDERDNVFILLGFDTKANPVEILYNAIGEDSVNGGPTGPISRYALPQPIFITV